MKVTVKYFGALAEEAGLTEEVLNLAETGSEVESLKAFCIEKYGLKEATSIQIAVNQVLKKDGVLQNGEEVAFLPPFAGG